jgi:hypothetical protein
LEEIRRLANFLEVDCEDDMIENIAHKCGFDNLKNAHVTVKKTESKVHHYRKGDFLICTFTLFFFFGGDI